MSIDTACSSALVGVHMGAAHVAKASVPALAAGVNLMLAERTTAATQVLHWLFCWIQIEDSKMHLLSLACSSVLLKASNR